MEERAVYVVDDEVEMELTTVEKAELARLEKIIAKNTEGVFAWGLALMEIKGKRLYRDRYATFENYVKDRWEMGKSHAYRLIAAGEVFDHLSPIGDGLPTPANEAQVRPLKRVPASMQRTAWETAAHEALNGRITARLVSKVVNRMVGPAPKKSAAKVKTLMDAWNKRITWMIDEVERANKQGWDDEVKAEMLEVLKDIVKMIEEEQGGSE